MKMIYLDDSERLLGKRWEISGLPLSMGGPALIELMDSGEYPRNTHFVKDHDARGLSEPRQGRTSGKCSTIKDWQL